MQNPAADPGKSSDRPAILIVGASTRAAAHSAIRGGMQPVCVDLFADFDLCSVAQTIPVTAFPEAVPGTLVTRPRCNWMFTGGLENQPEIVSKISSRHRLLGNHSDALVRIRDPYWIAGLLRTAKLPALEVRSEEETPPEDGTWLRKPLAGAGGRGICVWDGEAPETGQPSYFQKRAVGEPFSAQFLATPVGVELLGAARQLIGVRGVSAPPFAWCGNIFPAELDRKTIETMTAIGRTLALAADLRGLFGCDFLVSDDVPWLTEVNPRYTGAMELLEHRRGRSLVESHVAACAAFEVSSQDESTPSDPTSVWYSSTKPRGVLGKVILYADQDLIADDARTLLLDPRDDRLPFVADLPHPGQAIPAGQPVCTLFATDRHEDACIARLIRCAKRFRRRFLREA